MRHTVSRSLAGLSLALLATACSDEDSDSTGTADAGGDSSAQTLTVGQNITADTTWTSGSTVTLTALVFVESGATLTIEPGVTVKGDNGSALVIARGARIEAAGTAESPIVFTSSKAEGARQPGDWGGLVLLGSAPINAGAEGNIEGMEASSLSAFGGTDAAHDCGSLSYARIEFGGFTFGTDNELNGLTLGGCGSATSVDHVQVHKGKDDGIEVFGGRPNLKYILISQPTDDGFDWDMGFDGKVQFLVVQQNASAGDKAFEGDNLKDAVDATPRSRPVIYNATLVGSDENAEQGGLHVRRGSGLLLANAIVTGFRAGAVDLDGDGVDGLVNAGTIEVKNVDFFGNGDLPFAVDGSGESTNDDAGFDEAAYFAAGSRGIVDVDPQLADPHNLTAPDFKPGNAAVATGGAAVPAGDNWWTAATFHGAFDPAGADWTDGWTAFPQD